MLRRDGVITSCKRRKQQYPETTKVNFSTFKQGRKYESAGRNTTNCIWHDCRHLQQEWTTYWNHKKFFETGRMHYKIAQKITNKRGVFYGSYFSQGAEIYVGFKAKMGKTRWSDIYHRGSGSPRPLGLDSNDDSTRSGRYQNTSDALSTPVYATTNND